jgi:hypothetical protein
MEQITISHTPEGGGSDDEQYNLLVTSLKTADEEFKGLPDAEEVTRARTVRSQLETEAALLVKLKAAVPRSVWHNTTTSAGGVTAPVENGRYDSYQPAASLVLTELFDLVSECKKFGVRTKEGRQWVAVGELCIRLRAALIGWLKAVTDAALWKKVEEQLITPGGSDSLSIAPDAMSLYHNTNRVELAAVKREMEYRVQVARASQALDAASNARDEAALEHALQESDALNMTPTYHESVRTARSTLARIGELKRALTDATDSVTPALLVQALNESDAFGYRSALVERCRKFGALVVDVQTAVSAFAQTQIESALHACAAAELGMNQQCAVLTHARAVLAKIVACREAAQRALDASNAAQAPDQPGSTEAHAQALRAARDTAQRELGGLNGVPEIDGVRSMLERLDAEATLFTAIRTALQSGAWLNTQVKAGDYERYQAASSIDTVSLDSALQAAIKFECRSSEGRASVRAGQCILSLRRAMAAAVGSAQDVKQWAAVEAVLDEAKRALSAEQLASSQELGAARLEHSYQMEVAQATAALRAAMQAVDPEALTSGLHTADTLHMQPKYNAVVVESRALLARIVAVRAHMQRAMDEVDEALLVAAAQEAADIPYRTPEVVLCEQFRDTVQNLKKANAAFDLKQIEAGLEKVECRLYNARPEHSSPLLFFFRHSLCACGKTR